MKSDISNLFEKYLNINEWTYEEITKDDKLMWETEDQGDDLGVSLKCFACELNK